MPSTEALCDHDWTNWSAPLKSGRRARWCRMCNLQQWWSAVECNGSLGQPGEVPIAIGPDITTVTVEAALTQVGQPGGTRDG